MERYTGTEVCPKCGVTQFSITFHNVEANCDLEPLEHMHLTCPKCSAEIVAEPLDTVP